MPIMLKQFVELWGCLHDTGVTFVPARVHPGPGGSVFVYMIPPENVILERVLTTRVHPGCCIGLTISFRYEILQHYHVQGKRRTTTRFGMKSPPCRLEAYRHHVCNFHSHMQSHTPRLCQNVS